MASDGNGLRQRCLDNTLGKDGFDDGRSELCVICLEQVTEPALAVPCSHRNFDFLCLASWLEQRAVCPLCQTNVAAVEYELESPDGPKTYTLPASVEANLPQPHITRPRRYPLWNRRERRFSRQSRGQLDNDDPIARRRHVYRHHLYSLRVGSNRRSQYRELVPQHFHRDESLVSRARQWIRRELQVFSFLDVESEGSDRTRRTNNAEFLLEYIIAILRTVDMKGSGGQAAELLGDFLGRDNACLFLHELQTYLRSPYTSLADWDRAVQYDEREVGRSRGERGPERRWRRRSVSPRAKDVRVQRARREHRPD